jgi:CHAD domain-containing protein
MAFRIKRRETVSQAIARVVRAELDGARAAASDARAPLDERVHAVRLHVKKARAALALARHSRHRTRPLDRRLRELGRGLSNVRDDAVTRDVSRELARAVPGPALPLATSRTAARRELEIAVGALERLWRRRGRWPVEADGRSARRAFARSFRRARRIHSKMRPQASDARFHRWRKAVKRLALQMRLCRRIAPELDRFLDEPASRLSELLGEVHDLAVVRVRLVAARSAAAARVGAALRHLQAREREARAEALALGARVLAPRPRLVKTWLRDGWRTWRSRTARRRTRARRMTPARNAGLS